MGCGRQIPAGEHLITLCEIKNSPDDYVVETGSVDVGCVFELRCRDQSGGLITVTFHSLHFYSTINAFNDYYAIKRLYCNLISGIQLLGLIVSTNSVLICNIIFTEFLAHLIIIIVAKNEIPRFDWTDRW